MEEVNWGQPPGSVPEGINPQQATQLHHGPAAQASQAEEPADQPAEAGSDPEVSSAWMSDLVQELVNTQASDSTGLRSALSTWQLSQQNNRAGQGRNTVLLPRTREIEQEVSTMQQEANAVTNKSKEEQAEVEEELARMAKLVFTFQVCNRILSSKTETNTVTY